MQDRNVHHIAKLYKPKTGANSRRPIARLLLLCLLPALLLLADTVGVHAAADRDHEPAIEKLLARVDGREAHIDPDSIEAYIYEDGEMRSFTYPDFLDVLLTGDHLPQTAEYVHLIVDGQRPQTLDRVNAILRTSRAGELGVTLENFSTLLARGPRFVCIGIPGWWELCFWIEWESERHPQVIIDGRLVHVLEAEATFDGDPISMGQAMRAIGSDPISIPPRDIDVYADNGRPVSVDELSAEIHGSDITIAGLGPTMARIDRDHPLQICITIGPYLICVKIDIDWAPGIDPTTPLHPRVTADGNPVHAEVPTATLNDRPIDYARALEIIGSEAITTTAIQIRQPEGEWQTLSNAHVLLEDNHFAFTGLSRALARYSLLEIRMHFVDVGVGVDSLVHWRSEQQPIVTVDAREVLVGEPTVHLEGRPLEFEQAITIIGRDTITTSDLKIRTTSGDPVPVGNAYAIVRGNEIELRAISDIITIHIEVEVCITIFGVEFCFPVEVGKKREPQVHLNGREVMTYNARGEIDGEAVDPLQIFTLIREENLSNFTVEITGAGSGASTQANLVASVEDNQIFIEGFDRGFWSGRERIEICIGTTVPPEGHIYICVDITDWIYPILGARGQIDMPAHRLHSRIDLRYTEHETALHPIPEDKVALENFSIVAEDEFGNPVRHLDRPYTVTVELPAEAMEGLELQPQSVQLVVWDILEEVWTPLQETSYFPEERRVVGQLDHFSDFAVLAELQDEPQDDPEGEEPEGEEPEGEEPEDEEPEDEEPEDEEPEDEEPGDESTSMRIYLPFAQR